MGAEVMGGALAESQITIRQDVDPRKVCSDLSPENIKVWDIAGHIMDRVQEKLVKRVIGKKIRADLREKIEHFEAEVANCNLNPDQLMIVIDILWYIVKNGKNVKTLDLESVLEEVDCLPFGMEWETLDGDEKEKIKEFLEIAIEKMKNFGSLTKLAVKIVKSHLSKRIDIEGLRDDHVGQIGLLLWGMRDGI